MMATGGLVFAALEVALPHGPVIASASSSVSPQAEHNTSHPLGTSSSYGAPIRGVDYNFLKIRTDGTPVRWQPCAAIRYAVNLRNAPRGSLAEVREAATRVGAVTGISWKLVGVTHRSPGAQIRQELRIRRAEPRYPPVLVSWLPHQSFVQLEGWDGHALAFAVPIEGRQRDGGWYVTGTVVVDRSTVQSRGFRNRFSQGTILMHEFGHIVGLAHVGPKDELMWSPELTVHSRRPEFLQTTWGPGDLLGLQQVGSGSATCGASSPPVSAAPSGTPSSTSGS
jgi:hypothetical protein